MQPLTPPPYLDHITLPNIEDWPNTDPDSEPAVEDWLQLRCPNLNIKELMSSYNKVTIPVEENFRLLWRLRSVVNAATDGDAESAVMQTLKDLESERVKSDERCRYIGQRLFFHNPFPDGEGAIWEALVRSKNLLSVNEAISTLFPYLFEKVNTETSEAKTTEQSTAEKRNSQTEFYHEAPAAGQDRQKRRKPPEDDDGEDESATEEPTLYSTSIDLMSSDKFKSWHRYANTHAEEESLKKWSPGTWEIPFLRWLPVPSSAPTSESTFYRTAVPLEQLDPVPVCPARPLFSSHCLGTIHW